MDLMVRGLAHAIRAADIVQASCSPRNARQLFMYGGIVGLRRLEALAGDVENPRFVPCSPMLCGEADSRAHAERIQFPNLLPAAFAKGFAHACRGTGKFNNR